MKYRNAKAVLPPALLEQLQQYAEGELLYIPRRPQNFRRWGEVQGSRKRTSDRNQTIRAAYAAGTSVRELAERCCLTEETVRKILYRKD